MSRRISSLSRLAAGKEIIQFCIETKSRHTHGRPSRAKSPRYKRSTGSPARARAATSGGARSFSDFNVRVESWLRGPVTTLAPAARPLLDKAGRSAGCPPAAGSGSRIRPLAFSKELLPVGSREEADVERPRAASEYLLDRMLMAGADQEASLDLIGLAKQAVGVIRSLRPATLGKRGWGSGVCARPLQSRTVLRVGRRRATA